MLSTHQCNLRKDSSVRMQTSRKWSSEPTWGSSTPTNSCLWMWDQWPNASTHSADLPHHDKSTALLAGVDDPQDQVLGNSGWPAENGQFCRTSRFENIDGHNRTLCQWTSTHQPCSGNYLLCFLLVCRWTEESFFKISVPSWRISIKQHEYQFGILQNLKSL
jgi:hypothetical protein